MKKRYTEEQIIKAIKRHDSGVKAEDIKRHILQLAQQIRWLGSERG